MTRWRRDAAPRGTARRRAARCARTVAGGARTSASAPSSNVATRARSVPVQDAYVRVDHSSGSREREVTGGSDTSTSTWDRPVTRFVFEVDERGPGARRFSSSLLRSENENASAASPGSIRRARVEAVDRSCARLLSVAPRLLLPRHPLHGPDPSGVRIPRRDCSARVRSTSRAAAAPGQIGPTIDFRFQRTRRASAENSSP